MGTRAYQAFQVIGHVMVIKGKDDLLSAFRFPGSSVRLLKCNSGIRKALIITKSGTWPPFFKSDHLPTLSWESSHVQRLEIFSLVSGAILFCLLSLTRCRHLSTYISEQHLQYLQENSTPLHVHFFHCK